MTDWKGAVFSTVACLGSRWTSTVVVMTSGSRIMRTRWLSLSPASAADSGPTTGCILVLRLAGFNYDLQSSSLISVVVSELTAPPDLINWILTF